MLRDACEEIVDCGLEFVQSVEQLAFGRTFALSGHWRLYSSR
ncbi:hypothetical protein DSUL_20521 [Desulfovibrionales bacterium]